ncbi:MAG: hypothetical protein L3K09_04005 [Thermoplasmata archaeon]|nr:hypothetical protein [Thermoplasmata archaeon]
MGRRSTPISIFMAGVVAATAGFMVLAGASIGGGAHLALQLKAPFKGTTNTPYISELASGCATVKAIEASWSKLTGLVHGSATETSKGCLPMGGSGATVTVTTAISVGIPFQVASNGAHSIASNWTINLSSLQAHTVGHCPPSLANPNPPLGNSEGSLCQDSAGYSFQLSASLTDISNYPWYTFNSSSANRYDYAGWEDSVSCSNYGTPSCSNYTGATGYVYSTGSNDPGFSLFTFSGSTTVTLWTNGTGMVATHHYLLTVGISISASCYTSMWNVKSLWKASANASINMAGPSHGAKLNSVTIV